MVLAVPYVHQGYLIPMTEFFKSWNPKCRTKRSSVAPCGLWNCKLTWITSRRFCLKPFGMGTFLFGVCWGINLQQMNVFWTLSKETLQYYAPIGLLVFDKKMQGLGHRWTPLDSPLRIETVLSKPRKKEMQKRVARLHYMFRHGRLVFKNPHIYVDTWI